MATRDAVSAWELARLRGVPDITRVEVIRYFTLAPADEAFVRKLRGVAQCRNVWGASVQLCMLAWWGFVPDEVSAVPAGPLPIRGPAAHSTAQQRAERCPGRDDLLRVAASVHGGHATAALVVGKLCSSTQQQTALTRPGQTGGGGYGDWTLHQLWHSRLTQHQPHEPGDLRTPDRRRPLRPPTRPAGTDQGPPTVPASPGLSRSSSVSWLPSIAWGRSATSFQVGAGR